MRVPKRVDHAARRQQIAEALLKLTANRGLEAVSLRQVATEAGVSMGAVQHYFKTKDEMLLFALEYQGERRDRRIRDRVSEATAQPTPKLILRTSMVEMLPTEDQSRTEWLVGIAYFIRALAEPSLTAAYTDGLPKVLRFFADQIRQGQKDRTVARSVNPDQEAAVLWALADSQGTNILMGHITPEEAVSTVDYYLDRLFGRPLH